MAIIMWHEVSNSAPVSGFCQHEICHLAMVKIH